MKKNFTLIIAFISLLSFGQIPAGYYDSATGLTEYALKSQLNKIIDDQTDGHPNEYLHTDQGYSALWTLFANGNDAFKDNYYENDGTLLDMYSENPTGSDPYNFTLVSDQCGSYSGEGDCYNREHLVPQSYFDNFQVDPMKNDPFHVAPSDGSVNGARNNLPFGVVNTANYTSQNGSKRGSNLVDIYSSYSGTVFEPIDEFKGDIARSLFYFATRYEDLMDDFYNSANAVTCQSKNMFDGSTNKVFSDAFLLRLIKWHLDDPVSSKEIAQNNAIFSFQNNRNPFIDNPDYVCDIWPTQCATLSSQEFILNNVAVFPNPSKNGEFSITATAELKNIAIYNVNGQLVQEIKNPNAIETSTYKVNNLATGFYMLQLQTENASVTKKVIVN